MNSLLIYFKAYLRKALGLRDLDKFDEAVEELDKIKEIEDALQPVVHSLRAECVYDSYMWKQIPADHPERVKTQKYLEFVKKYGGIVNKARIKFFTPTEVFLQATENIKQGEVIVGIPFSLWMPLEIILSHSPIG